MVGEGLRFEVHGPPERLDGLLRPAGRQQFHTELVVPQGDPRTDRHRRLVVADRLGRLLSLIQHVGEFEVGPEVTGVRLLDSPQERQPLWTVVRQSPLECQ